MLYESRQDVIKLFNDYFSIAFEAKHKVKYGEVLKILNLKQMLQRLPIALAQVKADNTSENLLSEIRQIIHSSYQAKEITKKVYSIITNSIKLLNRTDNIFMNSMNSSAPDPGKFSVPTLNEELELPDGPILYQILKIFLNISQKNMRQLLTTLQ